MSIIYEKEGFVDITPDTEITYDDIIIWNLEQIQLKQDSLAEQLSLEGAAAHDDALTSHDKLQQIIDLSAAGDSAIGDSNTQLLQKVDLLSSQVSEIQAGSNTIITYGVLYIPFAIIVFLFWRFFRTFLRVA